MARSVERIRGVPIDALVKEYGTLADVASEPQSETGQAADTEEQPSPRGGKSKRKKKSPAGAGIAARAIDVTTARNKYGIGRITASCQDTVVAVRNTRTKDVAYVMGPDMLKQLFEVYTHSLQDEIQALKESLTETQEAARASAARESFFELGDEFSTSEVDVPIPEGTEPSPEVEI